MMSFNPSEAASRCTMRSATTDRGAPSSSSRGRDECRETRFHLQKTHIPLQYALWPYGSSIGAADLPARDSTASTRSDSSPVSATAEAAAKALERAWRLAGRLTGNSRRQRSAEPQEALQLPLGAFSAVSGLTGPLPGTGRAARGAIAATGDFQCSVLAPLMAPLTAERSH
jgi:hypothetical protein